MEGGKALYFLDAINEQYPLVMHGVPLSIGGPHTMGIDYLRRLKQLADRVQPQWLSDHLCWSRGNAHHPHDLLPLPCTQESLLHVAARVRLVQDVVEWPVVLENVSAYVQWADSTMSEATFLRELSSLTGCYQKWPTVRSRLSVYRGRAAWQQLIVNMPVAFAASLAFVLTAATCRKQAQQTDQQHGSAQGGCSFHWVVLS